MAATEDKTIKALYATVGASSKTTKVAGDWLTSSDTEADVSVSVFNVQSDGDSPLQHVKVDVIQGSVNADYQSAAVCGVNLSKYAGIDAHVNLVNIEGGPFTANLGLGADTDVGIKDESVSVHYLGTGVTLGSTIGISVFGSGISLDLKKAFSWL